jgi:HEAT repeat protein
MIAPSEFQPYLQEICRRYEEWWTVDALTETIADRQATFSFEQMVQTEEKKPEEEKKAQIVSLPILQGIQNYVESEHILLVGSPGVGKSTALLHYLVSFAKKELEKPEPRIPVLVPLKRYRSDRSSSEDPSGILWLIKDTLEPELWLEISDIKRLLFQDKPKRLILILDGLNEMSAGAVRTELEEFRKKCERCKVPFICTAREGSGTLGIKRRLEIQPLNPLEIDRFLRECMPGQAQQVLQLLSRDNRELSRTPFVLWMLYHLFQETGTVVDTLGQAFRQFFQTFKKYKEDAPVKDERRKAWNPWLEHLAFTMLNSLEPTDPGLIISDERAEKLLVEKFGDLHGASFRIEELLKYHVLERVSDREVSFQYQLIQEYYAAEYLLLKLPELSDEELKFYYLNYLKWTEPIAIMLGLPEITDNQAKKLIALALDVDLYLGARLAGEVHSDFQQITIDLVISECEQRKLPQLIKVICLKKSRSVVTIQSLIKALNEPGADIQAKALQALKEIANATILPYLLQAIENTNGKNYLLIIDIIDLLVLLDSKKTTLPKLRELLKSEYPGIREIAVWALARLNTKECISDLINALHDPTVRVRRAIISALGEIGYQEIIPYLLNIMDCQQEEEDNQIILLTAAFALAKLDSEQALLHRHGLVRRAVISLLEKQNLEVALPGLTVALKDTDCLVRAEAMRIIGKLKIKEFIGEVLQGLEDSETGVKMQAAYALGQICSVEIMPELLKKLKSENSETRNTIVDAMQNLDSEQAVPGLFQALVDSDQSVRRNALYALGQLCRKNTIPHFIRIFLNPTSEDYNISINNYLHELEHQQKSDLLEQANCLNTDIRWEAVKKLARVASQAAIPDLIKDYSRTRSAGHRLRIIDSLRSTVNEQILPTLNEKIVLILQYALNDAEVSVRRYAAFAFGDLGSCLHLDYLWQQQSQNPLEAIDIAIAAIQSRCQFYNYDITLLSPPKLQETFKKGDSSTSYTFPNAEKVQIFEKIEKFIDRN